MNTTHTLSELLRDCIHKSGLSHAEIARGAGIERGSLMRFARGDTSLRLDIAERLVAYFGVRVVGPKKGVKRG